MRVRDRVGCGLGVKSREVRGGRLVALAEEGRVEEAHARRRREEREGEFRRRRGALVPIYFS